MKQKRFWISTAVIMAFALMAIAGWFLSRNESPRQPSLNENSIPEVAANAISAATQNNLQAVYRVQKGDTLYGIAKKHKISVSALRDANQDKDEMLAVGEVLVIPRK